LPGVSSIEDSAEFLVRGRFLCGVESSFGGHLILDLDVLPVVFEPAFRGLEEVAGVAAPFALVFE